ncbi:MAG: SDR family oxidoreductase [Phycisphaerales bacterium]
MASVDIRGKAIAITGASSGIGAATAVECARAGMDVALLARRADRLDEVAQRVRALGARAVCVPGSVEKAEDCERLIEACVQEFGSIHAVFANAGIGYEGSFAEMSDADLRRVFEINFFGSMNAVRPAIERMKAQGSGHVLFCSSCLSKITLPYYGAYCATKTCQEVFARTMRAELKGAGLRVSSVHPIGTKTELFDALEKGSPRGNRLSKGPDYFLQPAERVGRAVVWCLRHPQREVWTGLAVRVAFAVMHATPGLTDRVIGALVTKRLRLGQGRSTPSE